jgi:hypothetical protein
MINRVLPVPEPCPLEDLVDMADMLVMLGRAVPPRKWIPGYGGSDSFEPFGLV